jgi:phospholipid transport system substrate-binding protein
MSKPFSLPRRAVLAAALVGAVVGMGAASLPAAQAQGADPAQAFVSQNIQRGLALLNNKTLTPVQKRDQFEQFLTGLTDLKRIADFTLGNYRRSATPADLQAFEVAFQNYAVAVYQYYFSRYSGQTLKVTGSTQRAATDYIVATQLVDPAKPQPLEVSFRVRTDGARPVVTDVSVEGVWLSLQQRDQFVAFLGQNNGNIRLLVTHLSELAKQFKS